MSMPPKLARLAPWIILAGDLLALLLFVFQGQRDHELVDPNNPALGVLLAGLPFLPPWIIAAFLLGAYRVDDLPGRPYKFFARSINAWLVAAPLGLVLRALVLGRAVIPTLFVIAGLGFGALFVLGWRLAFALVWTRVKK